MKSVLNVQNSSHDPFYNQAFEEFVFQTFQEDDIFFLWQNSPAVVVGSYQNICREVHERLSPQSFYDLQGIL